MKKAVINIVAMLIGSSLLFVVILLALLPKGKYADNISFNIIDDVLQEYTRVDIYSNDFEKEAMSIESNIYELYQYDFDENMKNYLIHMNGKLIISLSNNKNGNRKNYNVDIKNYFPFKTVSLIEVHDDYVTVNYKYDFKWLFLLLEFPTAIFLTFVILKNNLKQNNRNVARGLGIYL